MCSGQSHVHKVISPGGVLGVELCAQRLRQIQTVQLHVHGQVFTIRLIPAVVVVVNSVGVVIAHFHGIDLVSCDFGSNGILFLDAGVLVEVDAGENHGNDQNQCNGNHEDSGICLKLLSFFLLLQLLFGQLSSLLFFTELFLSGCAHVIISSHIRLVK